MRFFTLLLCSFAERAQQNVSRIKPFRLLIVTAPKSFFNMRTLPSTSTVTPYEHNHTHASIPRRVRT